MEFGQLTFEELKTCAQENWPVILPTGCTEQQGPHLTVDFDTYFITKLSSAASEYAERHFLIKSLVLPTIPFGPTPEHKGFGSGYIHLPQAVHETVISAVVESLVEQGFYHLIIWRGCGQHDLTKVVESMHKSHAGRLDIIQPTLPFFDIWCREADPTVPGGHADSFSTSIGLYLRPNLVREDKIFNPESKSVDWDTPELDFSLYSKSGVIGDPTYASAELGEKLWQHSVQEAAVMIRQFNKKFTA